MRVTRSLTNPSDRDLRDKLYRRQTKLLGIGESRYFACLPGDLVRLNPMLLK
jgi:hypothetical protein